VKAQAPPPCWPTRRSRPSLSLPLGTRDGGPDKKPPPRQPGAVWMDWVPGTAVAESPPKISNTGQRRARPPALRTSHPRPKQRTHASARNYQLPPNYLECGREQQNSQKKP